MNSSLGVGAGSNFSSSTPKYEVVVLFSLFYGYIMTSEALLDCCLELRIATEGIDEEFPPILSGLLGLI